MKVILSADDFGRSLERNEAIDRAFKDGLIKSAALMVNTPFTIDAVNRAVGGGYLDKLHCHFNLCGGQSGAYTKPLTKSIKKDVGFCADSKEFNAYCGLIYSSYRSAHTVRKFWKVYKELCAQYNEFLRITSGKANNEHVDFHLYYNLNWPVSLALGLFSYRYKIKTIRYISVPYSENKRLKLVKSLSWNPFVKSFKACNIDYYLNSKNKFTQDNVIELYVHPDIVNEDIQDNSISLFGAAKQTLLSNVLRLTEEGITEFYGWNEI